MRESLMRACCCSFIDAPARRHGHARGHVYANGHVHGLLPLSLSICCRVMLS